jgi:membrane-associated phospholipid phosphatase
MEASRLARRLARRSASASIPPVPRRPIDILNAVVVLLLLALAVALAAAGRLPDWKPIILSQVALAAGVGLALFVVTRTKHSAAGRFFADVYPIAVVPQVFNCLQPLITGLGLPNQDANLVAIDRWLLAGHDAARLTAPFIRPWLSDLLFAAYFSFFLFPFAVGLPLFFRRGREAYRRFVFAVVLTFYVSYAGYFLVPARGPRYYQWPADDVRTRVSAVSRWVYDGLNSVEYTKDDVFPSGHVMVTTACLIGAWRSNRRLFWGLLPVGLLLATATIYCRYHYVADVVAGFALAFVTFPLAYGVYDRWASRRGVPIEPGRGDSTIA